MQSAPGRLSKKGKLFPHFFHKRLRHSTIPSFLVACLLLITASGSLLFQFFTAPHMAHAAAPANTAVLTYKNDNARSGQTSHETILNTTNVNVSQFGKRVSYPVDGQVYAQPLYAPNLTIGGSAHNVVFVATEHDSVYAFDADQTSPTPAYLWHTSFATNGATVPSNIDVSCNDMLPDVGITGTPVIDNVTSTLYVVALTKENGNLVYRLHALDITTGLDKAGSPNIIQASVPGNGAGKVNGQIPFQPIHERQRAALLMANNQIYMAFASFCDNGPYHGWVLGYTYDGTAFQQASVYNTSPNLPPSSPGGTTDGGGIWGAGGAVTADASGNLYLTTANGDFDLNVGGTEASDSILKLNAQLQLVDYFAPFNQSCLKVRDTDLGSGGPLIVPGSNEIIGGGKEGRIYVLDPNNLGKYTVDNNLSTDCYANDPEKLRTDVDKVLQELPPASVGGIYSSPTYWQGPSSQYVYFTGAGSSAKAFQLGNNGLLSTTPISHTPESFGFTGGYPIVSSNGTQSNTGVLWLVDPKSTLRAYDATNLGTEIYNSNQNAARDALEAGSFVKFSVPTVANGEVFIGTSNALVIYGLNPSTSTPTPTTTATTATPTPTAGGYNNIGISDDTSPGSASYDGSGASYSAQALQLAGINPGDNAFYVNHTVFFWPNAIPGAVDNYVANGQTIPVIPLSNASTLGFAGAATGGPTYGTATINYTDGSTQPFRLGFSDWLLNNGTTSPSFGNGKMVVMPYYNKASGKVNQTSYVFYTDVGLQTGKTVQSVTLPSTVSQGTMHVFAVATKQQSLPPIAYNNIATSDDANPSTGNFDGANSYSSETLQVQGVTPGAPITFNGVTFSWPDVPVGAPNNYVANGQVIAVTPVANTDTLAFLGAAIGGPGSGTATITYTDATTQTFSLGMSDWTLGGGNNPPSFGNQIALTLPYRNTPAGLQTHQPHVLYAEVALQAGKTVQSVTLPSKTTGGQVHIFTLGTKNAGTGTPTPTPTPITTPTPTPIPTVTPTPTPAVYNNKGTSDDSATKSGNFDGTNSYSAQALHAQAIDPGSFIAYNGVTFTWPNAPAGQPNNYVAKGQTIAVTPANGATTLAFLGSASGGKSSGTITVTYTDGTTQTFTLGLSDWTLGGGHDTPSFSNQVVATTAYRNTPQGQQLTDKPVVLYADIPLNVGKTLKSVTLPSTVTGGQMHVFSIATK